MRHGQTAVEFFLVIGFIIALVAVLVINSENQLAQNTLLDNALISQSALDTVSNSILTVYVQGNGSTVRQSVFVPRDSICFVLDSGQKRMSCDVGDSQGRRVYSRPLAVLPDSFSADCFKPGWLDVTIRYNQPFVNISCTKTS